MASYIGRRAHTKLETAHVTHVACRFCRLVRCRDGHVASMREDKKGNVPVDMYCRHLRRKYQRMNPEFAQSIGKAMAYVIFSATVIDKSEDDINWLGYVAARLGEMGIQPKEVKQVFDVQRANHMAAKQAFDFHRKNTN